MPATHVNIFEDLKEARFRLLQTIVMYDGSPYDVLAITDHKGDGFFRIFLQPVYWDEQTKKERPPALVQIPADHASMGTLIDEWMETEVGKKSGVIRKRMDSKHFNRFRPFPLGMCNFGCKTFYIEWSPMRQQYQGLTTNSIVEELVSLNVRGGPVPREGNVPTHSLAFHECIRGEHPSAAECLEAMLDPATENDAHAFDRRFALVRGPVDMLFLAYKADIIGWLPELDFSLLRLGSKFGYCREVVGELGIFENIILS